jgi:uncharacterized membrane protein
MRIIDEHQHFLLKGIYITEALSYTISFMIIIFGIIRSIAQHILYYFNSNLDYSTISEKTRLSLGESSALALSFILCAEILKLFYIKSLKQLSIIAGLVIIKLLVNYFLLKEIKEDKEEEEKKNM